MVGMLESSRPTFSMSSLGRSSALGALVDEVERSKLALVLTGGNDWAPSCLSPLCFTPPCTVWVLVSLPSHVL